jgi:hypothetical protein
MFPYYFLRFSGPLLLILVGLKILSGYALVGRINEVLWLSYSFSIPSTDFDSS